MPARKRPRETVASLRGDLTDARYRADWLHGEKHRVEQENRALQRQHAALAGVLRGIAELLDALHAPPPPEDDDVPF